MTFQSTFEDASTENNIFLPNFSNITNNQLFRVLLVLNFHVDSGSISKK